MSCVLKYVLCVKEGEMSPFYAADKADDWWADIMVGRLIGDFAYPLQRFKLDVESVHSL